MQVKNMPPTELIYWMASFLIVPLIWIRFHELPFYMVLILRFIMGLSGLVWAFHVMVISGIDAIIYNSNRDLNMLTVTKRELCRLMSDIESGMIDTDLYLLKMLKSAIRLEKYGLIPVLLVFIRFWID